MIKKRDFFTPFVIRVNQEHQAGLVHLDHQAALLQDPR